ncbi:MAG TPA: hypothetical protein VGI14_18975 [Casimicrobiaceae bacterium]|jgi:hypothetical protein
MERIANPWLHLPHLEPFVLPQDAPAIAKFNKRASGQSRYELSLLPEPYFGDLSAPVVLLALNPGVSPKDAITHATPGFRAMARLSLEHRLAPSPFLHLQQGVSTPGSDWWRRIAREPIQKLGEERVAKSIFCVQ